MARRKRELERLERSGMRSPGRPGVARREDRPQVRALSASGRSGEGAAVEGAAVGGAAVGVGVSQPVGSRWFREAGGMPPTHLSPKTRSPTGRHLSFEDRVEISLMQAQGYGVRHMARRLNRDPSTISRELRRNAAPRAGGFEYSAATAQWHAERAARRPKVAKPG